jgi:hypothetical protein
MAPDTNHPKRGRRARLLAPLTHVVQRTTANGRETLGAFPSETLARGYRTHWIACAPAGTYRIEPIKKGG